MAQLFRPSSNSYSKIFIGAFVLFLCTVFLVMGLWDRSPYRTQVRIIHDQPVPFSHQHHVAGLGLDCRYCHRSVEKSSFAGIPPVQICMNCHSQIWTEAKILEPIRHSFKTGDTVRWTRVHQLPDFVYFNHSIHVAKGVGCATCHGRVDQMPLMWKENTLNMEWCLNCHRHPYNYLRPKEKVFDMNYIPPRNQAALGRELMQQYHVQKNITDCFVCHR